MHRPTPPDLVGSTGLQAATRAHRRLSPVARRARFAFVFGCAIAAPAGAADERPSVRQLQEAARDGGLSRADLELITPALRRYDRLYGDPIDLVVLLDAALETGCVAACLPSAVHAMSLALKRGAPDASALDLVVSALNELGAIRFSPTTAPWAPRVHGALLLGLVGDKLDETRADAQ